MDIYTNLCCHSPSHTFAGQEEVLGSADSQGDGRIYLTRGEFHPVKVQPAEIFPTPKNLFSEIDAHGVLVPGDGISLYHGMGGAGEGILASQYEQNPPALDASVGSAPNTPVRH